MVEVVISHHIYRVHITGILVRAVLTVNLFITEQSLGQTLPVPALQLSVRADGLVSLELW